MYIVRKYHRQVDCFIASAGCKAFSWAYGLLALALLALAMPIFKYGAPPVNGRPWDQPNILDCAWRILNGQVPHRDFYDFHGDLPFYMTYLGMKLGHPSLAAIEYGNILMMALLIVPTAAVLRRRTSALFAFLYCLFIALLIITPRPMGDPYDYIDHAMMYNRYGEAFLALLGTIVFLAPGPGPVKQWVNRLEAVLVGALLVALLGCKLNYFGIGLVFVGTAWVIGRFRIPDMILCAAGAAGCLALALYVTKIPLSDMIKDYRMITVDQHEVKRLPGLIIQVIKHILYLPVLLVLLWENYLGKAEQTHRAFPWREVLVIVVIFVGSIMLLSTNCQVSGLPLTALAALYGAEYVRRETTENTDSYFVVTRHLGALALVVLFMGPWIVNELKTARYVAFAEKKKDWNVPEALQSTAIKDYRFVQIGTRWAEMDIYMQELNDGVELLRRHASPDMRLNALLYSNPFELALGIKPAIGGLLSTDGLFAVSHPPLSDMIGNATHVMLDKDFTKFKKVYGAEWDALHLELVEETPHFVLFKVPPGSVAQLEKAKTSSPAH
jgi:hypothetical protein